MIPDLEWGIQGHTFQHNFMVFPLGSYDMILGDDWLCDRSPMWVHWCRRIICFTHQKSRVTLHGVQDTWTSCKPITNNKLHGLMHRGGISHLVQVQLPHVTAVAKTETVPLHSSVQMLIQEFDHLFQKPSALPPSRSADHRIPLILGAQPVKRRPYRYMPDQKNEIEHQVYEMLANGIIQHNHSPFASPVLLVRKKDGT
jgi:hypothetical protein